MPVSLDEMMEAIPPSKRDEIERNASSLVADYRLRDSPFESDLTLPSSAKISVGTRVRTGQRCPGSGVWRVENIPTATLPIAIDNVMPRYGNQAVTWELVQHIAA